MAKVKAKAVKKEVWNTCGGATLPSTLIPQIRLTNDGWQKRYVRENSKIKGHPFPVDNSHGLEAFELAKTFKGGA